MRKWYLVLLLLVVMFVFVAPVLAQGQDPGGDVDDVTEVVIDEGGEEPVEAELTMNDALLMGGYLLLLAIVAWAWEKGYEHVISKPFFDEFKWLKKRKNYQSLLIAAIAIGAFIAIGADISEASEFVDYYFELQGNVGEGVTGLIFAAFTFAWHERQKRRVSPSPTREELFENG